MRPFSLCLSFSSAREAAGIAATGILVTLHWTTMRGRMREIWGHRHSEPPSSSLLNLPPWSLILLSIFPRLHFFFLSLPRTEWSALSSVQIAKRMNEAINLSPIKRARCSRPSHALLTHVWGSWPQTRCPRASRKRKGQPSIVSEGRELWAEEFGLRERETGHQFLMKQMLIRVCKRIASGENIHTSTEICFC